MREIGQRKRWASFGEDEPAAEAAGVEAAGAPNKLRGAAAGAEVAGVAAERQSQGQHRDRTKLEGNARAYLGPSRRGQLRRDLVQVPRRKLREGAMVSTLTVLSPQ